MKVGDLVTPTGRLVLPAGQLKSEAWLQARRWRGHTIGPHSLGYCIGSSDVPSILDLPHVDTPAHVYRNKVYDIRREGSEQMLWGTLFEGAIAMEWCRRNRAVIDEIGLVARDGAPWHQSTIDRRVRECPLDPERKGVCGLEVKHMEYASASRWLDDVPDRLYAQMLHQRYVTGYDHIHYAAKVPGAMRQGVVGIEERDEKVQRYVVDEVNKFRSEYLVRGVEPAWNLEKADKLIELDNATYPERTGVLDVDTVGAVMAYAQAQAEATAIDKRKKELAAELRQLAAGAEIVTFSGERAYWYKMQTRRKTDLERLKERHPEAYADCVTEEQSPTLYIDKAYKPRGAKQ